MDKRISIKKINNEVVKPIVIHQTGDGKKQIKGDKLFPGMDGLYANIFLLGKKRSGKTSTINTILDKCAGKHTKVIIFASTINKDANWISIVKRLRDKEIAVVPLTSIHENGVNQIELIVKTLQDKAKEEQERAQKGELPKPKLINIDDEEDDEDEPEKKTRYLAPEYIILMDDLSSELKDPAIDALLKRNRHFKAKVIISSQYWIDMAPSTRQQLDFVLLFPKLPEEKLKQIYKDCDLSINYEDFLELYYSATSDPFNFLYVNTRQDKFRKNFNIEIDFN